MRDHSLHRRLSVLAIVGLTLAAASECSAQGAGSSADPNGTQKLTRGLTNPNNGGVAGTGMGTTDKTQGGATGGVGAGGATGTGLSVKGPPGAGITGPETSGMSNGGNGSTGTGASGASGSGAVTKPTGQ